MRLNETEKGNERENSGTRSRRENSDNGSITLFTNLKIISKGDPFSSKRHLSTRSRIRNFRTSKTKENTVSFSPL